MAPFNEEEVKVEEVNLSNVEGNEMTTESAQLPVKAGFWSRFKAFWLQDIDWKREIVVELTPYQQKIENEINEFLHQDVGKLLFRKLRF